MKSKSHPDQFVAPCGHPECNPHRCGRTLRGGAREGAGRKPRTIPRKAITVRLEPQDADRLRELCRAEELSQANWIAKQIRLESATYHHDR
jgi:hypothetical protein